MLLRQLRTRFGEVPPVVTKEIAQADRETLGRLAERVVQVSTLEEFIAALQLPAAASRHTGPPLPVVQSTRQCVRRPRSLAVANGLLCAAWRDCPHHG
jgi:hypothetical protein